MSRNDPTPAPTTRPSLCLCAAELAELTGRVRPSAQRRARAAT